MVTRLCHKNAPQAFTHNGNSSIIHTRQIVNIFFEEFIEELKKGRSLIDRVNCSDREASETRPQ